MTKDEVIALFSDDVEVRKQKICEFIMDTTNTYEDRYEVWKNTPDHLRTDDPWVTHLDKFDEKYGEISWYDDFYHDRYAQVDLRDCINSKEGVWDDEKVKDFITECMDNGFHGFYNDW